MKYFSYYPGCTLKTKAKRLWTRARVRRLARWAWSSKRSKTGSAAARCILMAEDEIATQAVLRARAGRGPAEESGAADPVLRLPPRHQARQRRHAQQRVHPHPQGEQLSRSWKTPYAGETRVVHYLEMLRDEVGFDKLKKAVMNPLKGRKIAAYYGCLLLRPSSVMAVRRPGKPHHHRGLHRGHRRDAGDVFAAATSAAAAISRWRTRIRRARSARARFSRSAEGRGRGDGGHRLPAVHVQSGRKRRRGSMCRCEYFTELLAEALGVQEQEG